MKYFYFFIFCLVFLPIYGQGDLIQPAPYVNAKSQYSIQFPATWEVVKDAMGTDVMALAPAEDAQDLFRKNVNIISAKVDENWTRKEYYSRNIESLNRYLEDFDLESNEDVQIGLYPARQLIFTHTIGVVNVKVLQYLMIFDGKALVITFTANRADFNKYRPQFDQIAQSLLFKP